MTTNRLVLTLMSVAIGMFVFGYAMVPIYNVLCKNLGINGKTGEAFESDNVALIDDNRTIIIEFLATNNEQLPWDFYPKTKKMQMHPGEMKRVAYIAKNLSNKTMSVQAIPSVSPGIAARYLKKTECFCFTQQTLQANEQMDMPILFHIDPALPKEISTVTVSYTLFDVTNHNIKSSKVTGRIAA